jgi:DNA repair exonuclease SbcCD ATPase subunit
LTQEKEQVRNDLQSELETLMREHNQVKQEYGRLADTLSRRDSIIQANAKEIKTLLNFRWEYYQIKKKLDQLRDVAKGYVRQMDSLYTVNQELREENQRIRENFVNEQQKVANLREQTVELQEIVENASVLRAYNIQSSGIRQRGSRQIETDKARRTDRVRVCFTLGENKLVEQGKKTFYIRIARPDNVVLVFDEGDEYSFMHKGEQLQYSIKRDVVYQGESMDLCVYWNKSGADADAMEGTYSVTIYMDNEIIGQSTFDLR